MAMSGKTGASGSGKGTSSDEIEAANLAVVERFFVELVSKKDAKGVEECLSEDFLSNNPTVVGRQGMVEFAAAQAKNAPKAGIVETFHFIAKGDLVIRHYTYSNDPATGAELAISDFFRVQNGKIVEYWDVVQPLGTES
jgi:predicted SnoaL-like aldol condensation-catalyzing enzyme